MHVKRWNDKWKTKSEIEYLEQTIAFSKGENGVFGIKVMRVYWQNFLGYLYKATNTPNLPPLKILNQCFPNLKFIFITRRDKVRQGISWMKFLQGSAWH